MPSHEKPLKLSCYQEIVKIRPPVERLRAGLTHANKSLLHERASVPQERRKRARDWTLTPLIAVALLSCFPLGEENVLNCSREVATCTLFVCVCCRGLAEVICFLVPLAALIDDHSLFRANTPLLSGVHYSKRVSPGKRGSLRGKKHSLCASHKVRVGKTAT